jgi:NAD(P)-dependent dehydrogenase (short-subunit alcohol dehydrogenase family)
MIERSSIFITGAASGIGRATALHFAEHDWFVGLFDLDTAGLEVLHDHIGPARCCMQHMDVTDPMSVREAVALFRKRTEGRMDVLFNCAGILPMGRFEQIPLAEHTRTVDINITGVLNGISASFDLLRHTPGAHVISMSSGSVLYGIPELAVYAATKFAVRGLTEALSIEFEPYGITVCDIMPPYVDTPLLKKGPQATSVRSLGVRVQPEEVARTVWRAAHGRKVHGLIRMRFLAFLRWLLPFASRPVVRALMFSDQ